jgi:acetyl-CoA acetyltransferase
MNLVHTIVCYSKRVDEEAVALGCTGAKLSVQLFNDMRRRKQKYGVVTKCVGTGQGAASVFELLN